MTLWKKAAIICWIDSVLFISALTIPAHKAPWPCPTATGNRARAEWLLTKFWFQCINLHRVWEYKNFSFISFKILVLSFVLQNFVSHCALGPFQKGCLLENVRQPERVKISQWFPNGGAKMMTDWERWQHARIECTALAGHIGASQHLPRGSTGDHCINCQLGVVVPWVFEGRGLRQPCDIQWALPRFRAKILFYFLLYFIAFFLMLFSFKDSVPRQDYDTPPAVVSGRKILIPLRFDWRGEMEVAWFSPKLFKAVILNRAGYRNLNFSSGIDSGVAYMVQKSIFNIPTQFVYGK